MKKHGKKLSLYLETSVWNFFFADDAPERRDLTKLFFKEVELGYYHIFVSNLVSVEIGYAQDPKRTLLENFIREYEPIQLGSNEKVEELAQAYLRARVVPKGFPEDIIHVAYAVAHDLDAVVSWNLKHLVRLKTKLVVNGVNKLLGYKEIEIVTPEEVIGYGK